jgi:hypothetical protein
VSPKKKKSDAPVDIKTKVIEQQQVPGMPLGRHVRHDPRSWNYPAPMAPKVVSILHKRHGLPFRQSKKLGCCTGNAVAGLLMTDPFYRRGRNLTERHAVDLYSRATHLDPFLGVYPHEDTGSSGLAAMKAAHERRWVRTYGHAFGLRQALRALVLHPVVTGVDWYDGFFDPDRNGLIKKKGSKTGGHEFLVVGIDVEEKTVRACNSWGPHWGDGGYFTMTWDLWDFLLHQDGDVATATAHKRKKS